MAQRGTFTGTFTADTYRNLVDLFGLGLGGFPQGVQIVGGFLQAQGQGATFRMVPRGSPAPATAEGGNTLSAGAGIGLQKTDEWRLDEIWMRNTTAGSNATVVFTGTLDG